MCIDFYYNNKKEGRFNANLNKNLRDSLHWSKSRRLDKSINLLNKTLLGLVIIARLKSHTPKNSRLWITATQNSALHTEMRNKKSALLPKLNTHFCMEFYTVFFIILLSYKITDTKHKLSLLLYYLPPTGLTVNSISSMLWVSRKLYSLPLSLLA